MGWLQFRHFNGVQHLSLGVAILVDDYPAYETYILEANPLGVDFAIFPLVVFVLAIAHTSPSSQNGQTLTVEVIVNSWLQLEQMN
jgi:hypothetical protein